MALFVLFVLLCRGPNSYPSYKEWLKIIIKVSMANNFKTGSNKINAYEYESVTQKVFITSRINAAEC
jgi:hypothetical protein